MPEYSCQNCGRHFFGWGVFSICNFCGGRSERIKEEKEAEL